MSPASFYSRKNQDKFLRVYLFHRWWCRKHFSSIPRTDKTATKAKHRRQIEDVVVKDINRKSKCPPIRRGSWQTENEVLKWVK